MYGRTLYMVYQEEGIMMQELNFKSQELLKSRHGAAFHGIACDGSNYYLTLCGERAVVKLNCCLLEQELISTSREYCLIAYDFEENCFWATAKQSFYNVYKLNCRFQEVKSISLSQFRHLGAYITGLSAPISSDQLYIAFSCGAISMDKDGCDAQLLQHYCTKTITGIQGFNEGFILSETLEGRQCLFVYQFDGTLIRQYILPCDYFISAMLQENAGDGCFLSIKLLANSFDCRVYIASAEVYICEANECECCNDNLAQAPEYYFEREFELVSEPSYEPYNNDQGFVCDNCERATENGCSCSGCEYERELLNCALRLEEAINRLIALRANSSC